MTPPIMVVEAPKIALAPRPHVDLARVHAHAHHVADLALAHHADAATVRVAEALAIAVATVTGGCFFGRILLLIVKIEG